MLDKGRIIPVIIKKRVETSPPLEINLHEKKTDRQIFREEQVSLDKIIENSDSKFYITGKTTKISLMNFLQLVSKHNIKEVPELEEEDVVLSSNVVTRIATASVVDEDEEYFRLLDAVAVGIFGSSFFLSFFALLTKTAADIKTFSWILLLVSGIFLANFLIKGIKTGELNKMWRVCIKSLSRR